MNQIQTILAGFLSFVFLTAVILTPQFARAETNFIPDSWMEVQSKLYLEEAPPEQILEQRLEQMAVQQQFEQQSHRFMTPLREFDPRSVLTAELLSRFRLLILVNKAAQGPTAQTLRLYEIGDGQNTLLDSWKISSGREESWQMTPTPVGVYTLDPNRFVPWPSRDANPHMKWAMYWDYAYTSRLSGYALHTAPDGTEELIGERASHGCIRMPYQRASFLFHLIQSQYAGPTVRFAFDSAAGHTNREGKLQTDASGEPSVSKGYQVLLVIINDPNDR